MQQVYLLRQKTSDQGTEGLFVTDGFSCCNFELPWRDNQKGISCIPSGKYLVTIRKSPKFGTTYWVTNVKGREYILIHSGNFAGDVAKGFKSNVLGCIMLGAKFGWLSGQRAVLNSRITVRKFMNFMNNKDFNLTIIGDLC